MRSGSTIPNPITLPSFSANGTMSGITTGLNCSARWSISCSVIGTKPQFFSHAGVVELLDPLHLALEVLHVERTERDALPLPDQLGAAGQPLGNGDVVLLAAALVDEEILRLVEAGALDERRRSSGGCAAS